MDTDLLKAVLSVLAPFIFIIAFCSIFYGGCEATTRQEWNNGICIDCGVRYELRGVDSMYIKYYVCPECGREVKRP